MAISQNYNYAPRLRKTTTVSADGTGSTSSTSVATRIRYLNKPTNRNSPMDPTGWRDPRAWRMTWFDGHRNYQGVFVKSPNSAGGYVLWHGDGWYSFESPSLATVPEFGARAQIAALNKMRDGAVELGVSFGERKEAAGMMLDRFTRVARAYQAVRRGNLGEAGRQLGLSWRSWPSTFLEYEMGWKPLLNDVYGAVKLINDKDRANPRRTDYWLRSKSSFKQRAKIIDPLFSVNGAYSEIVEKRQHDYTIRLDYDLDQNWGHLKTLSDWGILNPASVAWQLVPMSFIVDWAVPIGDFLNAITAAAPYSFRSGTSTVFVKATRVGNLFSDLPAVTAIGTARCEGKFMDRIVLTSFPVPRLNSLNAGAKTATSQTIATRVAKALSILSVLSNGR